MEQKDLKLNPLEVIDRLARMEVLLQMLLEKQTAYNTGMYEIEKTAVAANNRSIENKEDITNIRSNVTWLWRTTFGGIIAAILAILADRFFR